MAKCFIGSTTLRKWLYAWRYYCSQYFINDTGNTVWQQIIGGMGGRLYTGFFDCIAFQYYVIKPMKMLSGREAFIAALKADTLSLTFWKIGMYGWMAIANFLIFHQILKASTRTFWFMMQIGMLPGLLTAYPINW